MGGQHDHPAPLGAGLVEQLAAVHGEDRGLDPLGRALPGEADLQHGGGGVGQALPRQAAALVGALVRVDRGQVGRGDLALAAAETVHQRPHEAGQAPQGGEPAAGQRPPQGGDGAGLEGACAGSGLAHRAYTSQVSRLSGERFSCSPLKPFTQRITSHTTAASQVRKPISTRVSRPETPKNSRASQKVRIW